MILASLSYMGYISPQYWWNFDQKKITGSWESRLLGNIIGLAKLCQQNVEFHHLHANNTLGYLMSTNASKTGTMQLK